MNCPFCGAVKTNVISTGKAEKGTLQRRRQCTVCGKRFNTLEKASLGLPLIIKSDGSREEFNRDKLIRGVRISCAKRPVPTEKIEEMADSIERSIRIEGKPEISSRTIGDKVIKALKSIDLIAYIRYASVYLKMGDLHMIRDEIDKLLAESGGK